MEDKVFYRVCYTDNNGKTIILEQQTKENIIYDYIHCLKNNFENIQILKETISYKVINICKYCHHHSLKGSNIFCKFDGANKLPNDSCKYFLIENYKTKLPPMIPGNQEIYS